MITKFSIFINESNNISTDIKNWVIDSLNSWKDTFDQEYPNMDEETIEDNNDSYNFIENLIGKLESNNVSEKDYEDILFNLKSNYYNELEDIDIDGETTIDEIVSLYNIINKI